MSETLSQEPETLGSGYGGIAGGPAYPSQPATPSSTVQDVGPNSNSNLPPFSTFSADIDSSGGFGGADRLFTDTRLLDISNWDYYTEGLSGRLLERGDNGLSIISSQPQYRPWESKPVDSTSQDALLRHGFPAATPVTPVNTFADAFSQNGGGGGGGSAAKLPSFQSQFQSFGETAPPPTTTEPSLTTLTNLTPVSPSSSSSPLNSTMSSGGNFHTLSAMNARNYPLVPAPIQAREIPSIQQQFLDERHIQLYTHPATLNNTIHAANMFPGQNGALLQPHNNHHQLIQAPAAVVTVLKPEPGLVDLKLDHHHHPHPLKVHNVGLHPTQFQNPMSTILDNGYNGLEKKLNGFNPAMGSPTRSDFRKKERRKIRASSLESSTTESDGASSNMEVGSENSGQVAAISSTAGFKSPHHQAAPNANGTMDVDEISGGNADKQVKKKRKRCGECIGCQRKDNCGDCAPCRNDKSHQICKQRRCEKLTEKKNLYGDGSFMRGEARRGRGKGRGSGTYRGRKGAGGVSIAAASSTVAAAEPSPQPHQQQPQVSRPSPQPLAAMLKPDQTPVQQPMAPMPFYADPNRFPTPVWQADPTQGWAQGQFIQQIPAQPTLDSYAQQYANPIYQTYQQPGFETNTFYASPVQVLTSQRPPSAASHGPLTPRANGTYAHTPSPSPGQVQQNGHRGLAQYQEYGGNPGSLDAATTASGVSRPSSVGSGVAQNFTPTSNSFTTISSANFSPGSSAAPSYVVSNVGSQTSSGNGKPGYPQVNSSPQLVSHNSSGYPGGQYSGQSLPSQSPLGADQQQQQTWTPDRDRPSWEQNTSVGTDTFAAFHASMPGIAQMQGITTNNMQNNVQQQHQQQQNNMHQQQQQGQVPQQNGGQVHQTNGNETFSQQDRVNLNSRIKTMILNKQQSLDTKPEETQKMDQNSTGHFLSYSHHRRANSYSDGGGSHDYTGSNSNTSALDNFIRFASNDQFNQLKWNEGVPDKKPFSYQTNSSLDNKKTDYYGFDTSLYHKGVQNIKQPQIQAQPPSKPTIQNEEVPRYEIKNYPMQERYKIQIPTPKQQPPPYQDQNVFIKPEPFKKYHYENFKMEPEKPTQIYQSKIEVPDIKPFAPNVNPTSVAYVFEGDGGPAAIKSHGGSWCCRQGGTEPPTPEHLRDGACLGLQTQDEILAEQNEKKEPSKPDAKTATEKVNKEYNENIEKLKNNIKTEVPNCNCFPPDKNPPEPGSYYTHLGCANSLPELRKDLENKTGVSGKALRIEKICYTGKEGKTTQGCPMAKWIIRRSNYEEKILSVVKYRQGHTCQSAYIVVCIVAWEGVTASDADEAYSLLTNKLNRYGLPTTRRCATNEPRTCACQGLDPDTCGASFSFGCSWSMYYNGCKYARSKTVRKFRLSVKSEENEIEEKMHILSTSLSKLYSSIAPEAFKNQCQFEREATECRLGFKTGRPFSGVTACLDFCSHSHRDLHNMNNGCTIVASLLKHRTLSKAPDEQLHVLPLYVMDDTDEFGSKEGQAEKEANGSVEALSKYPCEVRVRSVPLQPCRRHGKKRKEEEEGANTNKKDSPSSPRGLGLSPRSSNHGSPRSQTPISQQAPLIDMVSMLDNLTDAQLQSSQVSSTVLDSPTMYPSWNYDSGLLNNQNQFVNQYGGQNQLYQNQSWLDPQRRQNLYLNSWGDFPGNMYKEEVKEIPDSTTALPNNALEDKAANSIENSPNFDDKSRAQTARNVPTPGRFTPNASISSSNFPKNQPNTYSTSNNQNTPWNEPNQNTITINNYTANTQIQTPYQHHSSVVPQSPELKEQIRQDRSNWNPSAQTEVSPFRIPKGCPPIRSQSISDIPLNPTFLKPTPPNTPDIKRQPEEKTIMHNANNAFNPHAKPEVSNWPQDIKGNLNDFSMNANYLNQNYPNSGYGNMSFNSYPYSPYETSPLNYDYNLYGAEKIKREEYLRNSSCYNSYGYQNYPNWCQNSQNWCQNPPNWCLYPPFTLPIVPEQPKSEPIGEVTDYIDNADCFKDMQMGGVAIALGHGSVLFECAKHEMHATTALKKPNRLSPTRISLVFYQHRNLNKPKHGLEDWEEKMRLRKLGITSTGITASTTNVQTQSAVNPEDKSQEKEKEIDLAALVKASTTKNNKQILMRAPTLTTMSWTTLFPMHPCMVTGPYQEGGAVG